MSITVELRHYLKWQCLLELGNNNMQIFIFFLTILTVTSKSYTPMKLDVVRFEPKRNGLIRGMPGVGRLLSSHYWRYDEKHDLSRY